MDAAQPRVTLRSDLTALIRQIATLVFVLIVAWLAFVIGALFLGQIRSETHTGIGIDTGALRADPGTPVAVVVDLAKQEPGVLGWTEELTDFNVVITNTATVGGATCFDVVAGEGTYVVQVDQAPDGWRLGGVARNTGPNSWDTISGALPSCLDR
jgi:hypothetical protein